MLSEIGVSDLCALKKVISDSVRYSIDVTETEAVVLIEELTDSLEKWCQSGSAGFGRKYCIGEETVGVVVVPEYRKVSHVFVSPACQGRGIGRALIEAALKGCRSKCLHQKVQLNSSTNAAGFYEAMGFRQVGAGKDRPGGCIPFEYCF